MLGVINENGAHQRGFTHVIHMKPGRRSHPLFLYELPLMVVDLGSVTSVFIEMLLESTIIYQYNRLCRKTSNKYYSSFSVSVQNDSHLRREGYKLNHQIELLIPTEALQT